MENDADKGGRLGRFARKAAGLDGDDGCGSGSGGGGGGGGGGW